MNLSGCAERNLPDALNFGGDFLSGFPMALLAVSKSQDHIPVFGLDFDDSVLEIRVCLQRSNHLLDEFLVRRLFLDSDRLGSRVGALRSRPACIGGRLGCCVSGARCPTSRGTGYGRGVGTIAYRRQSSSPRYDYLSGRR